MSKNRLGSLKKIMFWLIQLTWGFPQSLIGFLMFLFFYKYRHLRYKSAIITAWDEGADCISLGPFIFISAVYFTPDAPEDENVIMRHEYGHSLQSLILGPLFLPLIGIPSIIWCRLPAAGRSWRRGKCSYYSFYTERSADWLGGNERSLT